MKLDDTQVARVREWIDQGLKVSEIQTRLAEELGVRITYMEARFLLDDLKLRPKDIQPTAVPTPVLSGPSGPSGPGVGNAGGKAGGPGAPVLSGPNSLKTVPLEDQALPGGSVSVTVDEITRPGLVVSGKVTFRDGQSAEWGLDQYGSPMLMPEKKGYRPTQSDIMEFQEQLGRILSRMGY